MARDEDRWLTGAQLPRDFADLIACLNEAGVDYLLVGGYAVSAHGYLRATQDIDVWLRPSNANAQRVQLAMREFGGPHISIDDLTKVVGPPPTGVRFGRPPLAVDLLTSIAGLDFDEAWATSGLRDYNGLTVKIIGLDALVKNKRATGRAKSAHDADELDAHRGS